MSAASLLAVDAAEAVPLPISTATDEPDVRGFEINFQLFAGHDPNRYTIDRSEIAELCVAVEVQHISAMGCHPWQTLVVSVAPTDVQWNYGLGTVMSFAWWSAVQGFDPQVSLAWRWAEAWLERNLAAVRAEFR
jgi:hypothetical protein